MLMPSDCSSPSLSNKVNQKVVSFFWMKNRRKVSLALSYKEPKTIPGRMETIMTEPQFSNFNELDGDFCFSTFALMFL